MECNGVECNGDVNENTCVICLEEMRTLRKSRSITALPCAHCFHTSCINKFFELNKKARCPLCREEIIVERDTPSTQKHVEKRENNNYIDIEIAVHNAIQWKSNGRQMKRVRTKKN